ncbi:hypothetical protein ACJMK2_033928 [Sinanodonta woodiana]|uniref:Transposase n=1 Tax=Sinanodonta woodiana TaxID=1069815 RepID=A0ABD3WQI1_SINWO
MNLGRIRNLYTSKVKPIIIAYAEAHGNRAAGRESNVGESYIWEWRRMKERLKKNATNKTCRERDKCKVSRSGVLEWVMDRRKRGIAISMTEIRFQAILIAKQNKIDDYKESVS